MTRASKQRKFNIVEVVEETKRAIGSKPSRDMGRNLDTIEKARVWLTHPSNWFESMLFVLKWDGLTPLICSKHGMRLLEEPWDNGLPAVVVLEQRRLRYGGKNEDEFTEASK